MVARSNFDEAPDKKAKRQGISDGDEDALAKSLLKDAGFEEDQLDEALTFFEGAKDALEAGLEVELNIEDLQKSDGADLAAQGTFLSETTKAVKSGDVSLADAQAATDNLDDIDSTTSTGPMANRPRPSCRCCDRCSTATRAPTSSAVLSAAKTSLG